MLSIYLSLIFVIKLITTFYYTIFILSKQYYKDEKKRLNIKFKYILLCINNILNKSVK